jgi:hypothetical protein
MYSISVLAKLKNWKFIYYVDHLPSYLEDNPSGNLKYALDNGMELKIGSWDSEKKYQNKLFISEGGAISEAKYGLCRRVFNIHFFIHKKREVKSHFPFL